MAVIIAGFNSSNRVPGPYGEVLYGTSGQSAASAALAVLLVGLKGATGNLTVDTEVRQVFSKGDVDVACTPGGELACMAYDAIDTDPTVPIFICSPTAAGGAVAGTLTATVGGAWTTAGQITLRIAGKPVPVGVGVSDTTTNVAANIAAAVNGAYQGRLPLSASPSVAIATLTCKTTGIRGNQHIVFADLTQAPAGLTLALAGGTAVTGGGVPLSAGSGTETYTTLLSTILTAQYDRIALAANDSSSLAAWKAQIDAQAAAPTNILQHVCTAANGTLAAATSLAQTTLNDQRFQLLWELNAETHPSRIAAAMATKRAATEQQDPNAAYNYAILSTVAPMSQKPDWPSLATLVSAINNSVTPITTTGDGYAKVVRSITTKSLTSSNPDYSTLDTGQASTPDFVLKDLKLYWSSVFAPANPRVQDDPKPTERTPPAGVAYPQLWAAAVQSKLVDYAAGILSGTTATVPPILISVVPPQANFDPVAKRIMLAATVTPAYNNAQVGVSVRQAA